MSVMVTVPIEWVKDEHKLDLLYQAALKTQELTMSLQDQIAALTSQVDVLGAKVTTLQAAIDAEQEQVAAAIALLSADNPDVAAALSGLQSASAALDAATADVEGTIPDAPPAP